MKYFPALGSALLATAVSLTAQVSVELKLDQEQFLPSETLTVKVRITNLSGQTLRLGEDRDWLVFFVEGKDGQVAAQLSEAPVAGEFSVDSSTTAIKRVDLAPHFNLTRPGRYAVTSRVKIKQWGRELNSPPLHFDIIKGTKLWEQDFGVPGAPGAGAASPESRKYALLQAMHLKQIKLYLRLTDAAESKVLTVYPIGPMVSFSTPETQIDKASNLHVLYQTGARSFSYSVINPDGQLIARQTHDYTATRPVLRADAEGRIIVEGGARRLTAVDLPAAEIPNPAPREESGKP